MKELDKEAYALELLGHSFVKLPRRVLARMLSGDPTERTMGRLHALLFLVCYYKPGIVWLDGQSYPCSRGEFVGKQIDLAVWAEINPNSIGYFLRKLAKENLIRLKGLKGGTSIYLYGYDRFTQLPPDKEEEEVSLGDALATYMDDLRNGRPRHF